MRYFKGVRDRQLFRAAEALNYTQSGISQMMAGLEEELEVRLFARVKRESYLQTTEPD